ncbi:hypothetical protein HOD29_05020 [archaeon]|jgi:FtsH-binding integral membrane protein|nr:hypothetical protein [archaeon]
MSLTTKIWEDGIGTKSASLSKFQYRNLIAGHTILGMLVAILIAYNTQSWDMSILEIFLVGLGIPILGILIAYRRASTTLVTFFGYMLVVLGMSAIMGPVLQNFDSEIVLRAFLSTCGIAVLMSIIGLTVKKDLSHWGVYLFGALLALILVRVIQIFIPQAASYEKWYFPFIEYAGAALFSLLIIYDWNRGMKMTYNHRNAILTAIGLFLDIINLFIHLLRIMAGSFSKD